MDFGAGSGRVTFFLLKQGFDVTAVDVSTQSLTDLRREYNTHKTASWGILHTSTSLPKRKQFDAIVGADILHHVVLPETLPLLLSALDPNGRILFLEPNAWHVPWYIFLWLRRIPWIIEKGLLACSIPSLQRLLTHSGFKKITIEGYAAIPPQLTKWIPLLHKWNVFLGNAPLLKFFAFRLIVSAHASSLAVATQKTTRKLHQKKQVH